MSIDPISGLFSFWAWWALALALAAVETLAPGAFMLWLGIAAGLTGAVTLVADLAGGGLGWQLQLAVFAVFAIVSVLWGRKWARRQRDSGPSGVSRRADQLPGRTVVLTEPIRHGAGRAELDDTVWQVTGPDAPAGSVMRIVRTEGATLIVEHIA